jgi:hypothetical protein
MDLKQDPIQPIIHSLRTNAFCAGHSQGANGEVWVVGGDAQDSNKTDGTTFLTDGRKKIRSFAPSVVSNEGGGVSSYGIWTETYPDMAGGNRWYPTVVTMGDGDLIIFSGTTANLDFGKLSDENRNPTYEFYPPRFDGQAIEATILRWAYPHNLYPPAFQLSNGGVMLFVSNQTVVIDPSKDPGQFKTDNIAKLPDLESKNHQPWIYP